VRHATILTEENFAPKINMKNFVRKRVYILYPDTSSVLRAVKNYFFPVSFFKKIHVNL